MTQKLFNLGMVVGTPLAMAELQAAGIDYNGLLMRHSTGDWGIVDAHDAKVNAMALVDGGRIVSSYPIEPQFGIKVWIITEADRKVTTILLPEEY